MNTELNKFVEDYMNDPTIDVYDRLLIMVKGFEGVTDCRWQVELEDLDGKPVWFDQDVCNLEYEKAKNFIFGSVTPETIQLEDKWKDEMVQKYYITKDSVLQMIEPYYIRLAVTWYNRKLIEQEDKLKFYGLLSMISEDFAQDYVPCIEFSSDNIDGDLVTFIKLGISYGS